MFIRAGAFIRINMDEECDFGLNLLHSEWPKLYGVLAILSATGLNSPCYEAKALIRKFTIKHPDSTMTLRMWL